MPRGIGGIVCRAWRKAMIEHRREDNAHSMAARITAWVSERPDLLEINVTEPGLLQEFAGRGSFQRLVLFNKTTGEGPLPFERVSPTLDQEDVNAIPEAVKERDVDGQRGPRVIVTVGFCLIGLDCASHFIV